MEPWQQHIPTLNQRPTQPPLNRQQQAAAFAQRQQMYTQQAPATPPQFPIQPFKEFPVSEQEQLEAAKRQMDERGLKQDAMKLTEAIEETQTKQTIQQFYCSHVFQVVNAKLSVFPIRYKICKKCGLVK